MITSVLSTFRTFTKDKKITKMTPIKLPFKGLDNCDKSKLWIEQLSEPQRESTSSTALACDRFMHTWLSLLFNWLQSVGCADANCKSSKIVGLRTKNTVTTLGCFLYQLIYSRCLMVSTNQADPSCFCFRILWILMEPPCKHFFGSCGFLQGLRS